MGSKTAQNRPGEGFKSRKFNRITCMRKKDAISFAQPLRARDRSPFTVKAYTRDVRLFAR